VLDLLKPPTVREGAWIGDQAGEMGAGSGKEAELPAYEK
jgi:hypothetical protein